MTRINELHDRSPLRILEKSIHGGLGVGNLGVVCSGPGVGKSAFLVGVALDYLLDGRQVLHVAVDQPTDRILAYYDEIFSEIAETEKLEDVPDARVMIERNRRVHTYQQGTFSPQALETTLKFLHTHTEIAPALMIIDGYDWERGSTEELAILRTIAREQEAEMWLSARVGQYEPVAEPLHYPEPVSRFGDALDVVLQLKTADGTVHVNLLKDHDNPSPAMEGLDLDPTRLLIVRA